MTKNTNFNFALNPSYHHNKIQIDANNNLQLKKFNGILEEFIKEKIFNEEEKESMKKVGKKYSDWQSIFNMNMPFNIILNHQNVYLKSVTEYAENLSVGLFSNDLSEFKTVSSYSIIYFYFNL